MRLRAGARGYPNGIDLTLRAGEAVAVCTSARAGAALVRSILGFAEVLSGEIYVLGERVPLPRGGEPSVVREGVASALHPHGLVANLTLRDNLLLPLVFRLGPGEEDRESQASSVLEALDLAQVAQRRPVDVGEGACVRAAVGRAIMGRPQLLLLENLDAQLTAREIRTVMSVGRNEARAVLVTATEVGSATCVQCDRVLDFSGSEQ